MNKNDYLTNIIYEEIDKLLLNEDGDNANASSSVYITNPVGQKLKLRFNRLNALSRNIFKKGNNNAVPDKIVTDKMLKNNADTYEIPIKGGIMSYNITSINGTEVMHYFKNRFRGRNYTATFSEKQYDMSMDDSEYNDFINLFQKKVSIVVDYWIKKYKSLQKKNKKLKNINTENIFIYPVKSTSNFNIEMARALAQKNKGVIQLDEDLLLKDLKDLQLDDDFINLNDDFFNHQRYANSSEKTEYQLTPTDWLKSQMNRRKALTKVRGDLQNIANGITQLYNDNVEFFDAFFQKVKTKDIVKNYSQNPEIIKMAQSYINWAKTIQQYKNEGYDSYVQTDQPFINQQDADNSYDKDNPYSYARKSTGTVTKAFSDVYDFIDFGSGKEQKELTAQGKQILSVFKRIANYSGSLPCIPVYPCDIKAFQIKSLSNSLRMGLKGFYRFNDEMSEETQQQLMDIKKENCIVIVFDDNLSGGATLGDICVLFKENGIKNIIPITFGQMDESTNIGKIPLTTPQGEQDIFGNAKGNLKSHYNFDDTDNSYKNSSLHGFNDKQKKNATLFDIANLAYTSTGGKEQWYNYLNELLKKYGKTDKLGRNDIYSFIKDIGVENMGYMTASNFLESVAKLMSNSDESFIKELCNLAMEVIKDEKFRNMVIGKYTAPKRNMPDFLKDILNQTFQLGKYKPKKQRGRKAKNSTLSESFRDMMDRMDILD